MVYILFGRKSLSSDQYLQSRYEALLLRLCHGDSRVDRRAKGGKQMDGLALLHAVVLYGVIHRRIRVECL